MSTRNSESCGCPVHSGFGGPPKSLPLGISFSDRLSVRDIDHTIATGIYEEHHSYLPVGRTSGTPVHHGIYLDDRLVGAISYSYLLAGNPIGGHDQTEFMEVSRVCLAHDQPNLASCAMARSQKKFAREYAAENDIGLLVTYVREDYEGTMFAALSDGSPPVDWRYDGVAPGHQTSDRPDRDIRDYDKHRLICPLTEEAAERAEMATLSRWLFRPDLVHDPL